MPIQRIPLSQPIETRDGTLTKDSKCVNGYFETRDQKREFVKRPGLANVTTLPTGDGQGMFYFQNQLYAVVANILYAVNTDGTYSTIGSITGSIADCYFTQSSPTPINSNNTSTGSLALSVAGTYTYTVPPGVTLMTMSAYGAGGGSGSGQFCGDGWIGGGGSSGGYLSNQSITVNPGDTLTIVVGAGGTGGIFPGVCVGSVGGSGSNGGDTYVQVSGTDLIRATGGGGGGGGLSSNAAAGLPNGVKGQEPCNPGNCGYGYTGTRTGGKNGTGFGNGADASGNTSNGQTGASGYITIAW